MTSMKNVLTWASVLGVQRALRTVQQLHSDDVLGLVGLERRTHSNALSAIGLVMIGAAVGAGAALLLSPGSGAELRERLYGKLEGVKKQQPPEPPQTATRTQTSHA